MTQAEKVAILKGLADEARKIMTKEEQEKAAKNLMGTKIPDEERDHPKRTCRDAERLNYAGKSNYGNTRILKGLASGWDKINNQNKERTPE
jgi:hypothetical protein